VSARPKRTAPVSCEGCEASAEGRVHRAGTQPQIPPGFIGCGRSTKAPGRIAAWCPACSRVKFGHTAEDMAARIDDGRAKP